MFKKLIANVPRWEWRWECLISWNVEWRWESMSQDAIKSSEHWQHNMSIWITCSNPMENWEVLAIAIMDL